MPGRHQPSEERGPPFTVIMRRASYLKADLDVWITNPEAHPRVGGYRPRKTKD